MSVAMVVTVAITVVGTWVQMLVQMVVTAVVHVVVPTVVHTVVEAPADLAIVSFRRIRGSSRHPFSGCGGACVPCKPSGE